MNNLIKPHGGKLVNTQQIISQEEINKTGISAIEISERILNDLEMISTGVFSPLEGFLIEKDFLSVVQSGRLDNGLPWTIPIVLPANQELVDKIKNQDSMLLTFQGTIYGTIQIHSIFKPDKEKWAKSVFRTTDTSHPQVKYIMDLPEYCIGGNVIQYTPIAHKQFHSYRLSPQQSRELFTQKEWGKIVAFQTRNPIHRAHEYLLKCALEMADGLFIHPLVGATKGDDIPADVRMKCYTSLVDTYFPKERTILGVFPAAMNYAGPKEAIFHALCRKNYGCSHFIVGRDHAGVGKFYGTYDAHHIFDDYSNQEIEIIPLKFEHAFYCKKCNGMASDKTCSHSQDQDARIILSGTKVREMLSNKQMPPVEFTRQEIALILSEAYSSKN